MEICWRVRGWRGDRCRRVRDYGCFRRCTDLEAIPYYSAWALRWEEIYVELLEFGTGERFREVVANRERLARKAGRLLAGQDTLRLLNLALELANCVDVAGDVDAGGLLVLLDEVADKSLVGSLTIQSHQPSSKRRWKGGRH